MTQQTATATKLIDDDRARVTRFTFAPGAETRWHQHKFDYVIIAITDCKMLLETPDGSKISATIAAGDAYRRPAGVHHNVTNSGDAEMVFIEVEIK